VKLIWPAALRTHVDSKLAEVRVELTGESQARRDAGHDDRHEMVKVTICRRGELERAEVNVVKGLVIDTERLVGVLDELVDRKRRVVGLESLHISR
jgi:hypothetical protein